jgi:hypothetical protein
MSNEKPSEFTLKVFLSVTSEDNAKEFRRRSADWVSCYFAVNELAQRAFFATKISEKDHRQILAYSIFYRLLTGYQAVFLLTERGIDQRPFI